MVKAPRARSGIFLLIALAISGCVTPTYRQTPTGQFSGVLDIRWVQNDRFVFLPNEESPLELVRANGQSIRPGRIYTDGGSIPRLLWGVEGYSPWGYAPAYVVHDWVFEINHCGYDTGVEYSFDDSVAIIAEALKTLMEADSNVRDFAVFDNIVSSVASPVARDYWNQGNCDAAMETMAVVVESEVDVESKTPPEMSTRGLTETSESGRLVARLAFDANGRLISKDP